jgi:hypothetical protein
VNYRYWDESKGQYSMVGRTLSDEEIEELAENPKLRALGFHEPMQPDVFARLERRLFARRPEVELRVLNHHHECCDFSFLRDLPSLTRLLLRQLPSIDGVEAFAELRKLKQLRIEIPRLQSCELLEWVTPDLEQLYLAPKKIALDWKPLARFRDLHRLEFHRDKNVFAMLPRIPRIRALNLIGMEGADLGVLSAVTGLESLRLDRCCSEDLEFLPAIRGLRRLQIRGNSWIKDLSPIGACAGLEALLLSGMAPSRLPDLGPLPNLRALYLNGFASPEWAAVVSKASSLEFLRWGSSGILQPEDFEPVLRLPRLKAAQLSLGNEAQNQTLDRMIAARGLGKDVPEPEAFLEDVW